MHRVARMTTLGLLAACPDCPIGREARGLVFSDAFWTNAGLALLPFVIVSIAVVWFVRRVDRSPEEES